MLDRIFRLSENRTTVRIELLAELLLVGANPMVPLLRVRPTNPREPRCDQTRLNARKGDEPYQENDMARSPDDADAQYGRNPKGQAIFRRMASSFGARRIVSLMRLALTPCPAAESGLSQPRGFVGRTLSHLGPFGPFRPFFPDPRSLTPLFPGWTRRTRSSTLKSLSPCFTAEMPSRPRASPSAAAKLETRNPNDESMTNVQ